MYVEGSFPTLQRLRAANLETEYFSVEDLRSALRVISDLEPFTEDICGISEVLADSLAAQPEDIFNRLPENLASALKGTIACAAVARCNNWAVDELVLGTSAIPEGHPEQLEFQAAVSMYEFRDGRTCENAVVITNSFAVAGSPLAALSRFDLVYLYSEPELAVQCFAVKSNLLPVSEAEAITVRAKPGFIKRIEELNLHRQRPVLERLFFLGAAACAERIAGMEGAKVHPVRVDRAADSAQIEREDGAKLWRCMLTKEGAGYRLHYWSLPDGGIEFEAVMAESEVA